MFLKYVVTLYQYTLTVQPPPVMSQYADTSFTESPSWYIIYGWSIDFGKSDKISEQSEIAEKNCSHVVI